MPQFNRLSDVKQVNDMSMEECIEQNVLTPFFFFFECHPTVSVGSIMKAYRIIDIA